MLPPTSAHAVGTPAGVLVPSRTERDPRGKFPLLVSYHYLRKIAPAKIEWLLGNPRIEVLLDSGAFSALNAGVEVRLEDYIAFLKEWRHRLFGYVALDVLGDPKATRANLEVMHAQGLQPIPVHVRGMGQAEMDEMFESSPWVACGGMRRPKRGACPPEYLHSRMVYARGRNVHWLGYTRRADVDAYRPFSCDCSSWNSGVMYGVIDLYLGGGRWDETRWSWTDTRTKPVSPQALRMIEATGFTLDQFRDKRLWRQDAKAGIQWAQQISKQLCTHSWVRYIRDVRTHVGTRLFLASSFADGDIASIFHWVDETRPDKENPPYANPEWDEASAARVLLRPL